ncbi:MAG: hypothetical protein GY870_06150, partial [archaeon]|nr:hypothetical protein [archaeon]
TPGHRKGHVSYFINGKKKALLLTGDACDLKINFDFGVGPGFGSFNKSMGQKSLDKIIGFVQKYPQIDVVFGHESLSPI